jgi:hypothetical protein
MGAGRRYIGGDMGVDYYLVANAAGAVLPRGVRHHLADDPAALGGEHLVRVRHVHAFEHRQHKCEGESESEGRR